MGGIIPSPNEVVEALKEKIFIGIYHGYKKISSNQKNLVYQKSAIQKDVIMHYCPGCTHGVVHKILSELIA